MQFNLYILFALWALSQKFAATKTVQVILKILTFQFQRKIYCFREILCTLCTLWENNNFPWTICCIPQLLTQRNSFSKKILEASTIQRTSFSTIRWKNSWLSISHWPTSLKSTTKSWHRHSRWSHFRAKKSRGKINIDFNEEKNCLSNRL